MSEPVSRSTRSLIFASSRLSSLKNYVQPRLNRALDRALAPDGLLHPGPEGQGGERQGWRAWAGQKITNLRRGGDGDLGTETLSLFPGWAVRRYQKGNQTEFEVEVFVSGYASTQKPPHIVSRSQRALLRLAKGLASLPKLPDEDPASPEDAAPVSAKQPAPRPEEIGDVDIQVIDQEFKNALDTTKVSPAPSIRSSRSLSPGTTLRSPSPTASAVTSPSSSSTTAAPVPTVTTASALPNQLDQSSLLALRQLHANLEQRLQPFWSSALEERKVKITVSTPESTKPLAYGETLTTTDGSFQLRLTVPWEEICHHITSKHQLEERELVVEVELVPLPPPPPPAVSISSSTSVTLAVSSTTPALTLLDSHSTYPRSSSPSEIPPQLVPSSPPPPLTPIPAVPQSIKIPITHSPIRVISDIDDTVKNSGVLSGTRAAFHNVFVKDLRENVIPGMGEWYTRMWEGGVRFHYVSNGPFEFLPILNEFLNISQLPPGSIKLKSYAGRSLFNGLLSAPATRKRAGVVEVLEAFPESRFLLIGDSGEQDLELYADLAAEHSTQILAVLIRDADQKDNSQPIKDPTGHRAFMLPPLPVDPEQAKRRPMSLSEMEEEIDRVMGVSPRSARSTSLSFVPGGGKGTGPGPEVVIEEPEDLDQVELRPEVKWEEGGSAYAGVGKGYPTHVPRSTRFHGRGRSTTAPPASPSFSPPTAPVFSGGNAPALVDINPNPTPSGLTTTAVNDDPHQLLSISQRRSRSPSPSPSPSNINPNNTTSTWTPAPSPAPSPTLNNPGNSARVSSSSGSTPRPPPLSEAERRRQALQLRVYEARLRIPRGIPLRVFRQPEDCVEVEAILGREGAEVPVPGLVSLLVDVC